MAQPYVGEIRMFAGNFAPVGWMLCQGQTLPISENDVLFQLIGTTYGGDGEETFNLPDLQSRVPIHMGTSTASGITRIIGEQDGVESVTLITQQIPNHTHPLLANSQTATTELPTNAVLASSPSVDAFAEPASTINLAAASVSPVGGSQPHDNMQPYLAISFIISLYGVFPSQT